MKLMVASRILSALSLGAATLLTLVACEGTASYRTDIEIETPLGRIGVSHDSSPPVMSVTNSSGEPMDLRFTDSQGNVTGTVSPLESGTTVPIPPGSTNVTITLPSAIQPPGLNGQGGESPATWEQQLAVDGVQGSIIGPRAKVKRVEYYACTVPLAPELGAQGGMANLTAVFQVVGAPGLTMDDIWSKVEGVLLGGPGTVVPSGVQVMSHVTFVPDAGGARLRASDVGSFNQFDLNWNGVAGYASLNAQGSVLRYSSGNGWETCEVFVPSEDFASPLDVNDLAIDMWNDSNSAPQQITGAIQYFL